MTEKDVIIFFAVLSAVLVGWVVYLLLRLHDTKEDLCVARSMRDYYKDRLATHKCMAFKIRENLKDAD